MQKVDYLIFGGGIAGTTAAETIRKLDPNGTITIVSEEPHPLYSRVLLPHYIRGKVKREFVFLKNDAWYAAQSITLEKGRILHTLKPSEHEVILDNGATFTYGKLLLATGGRVKRLALPELPGITYFRTIEDADQILAELNELDHLSTFPRTGVVLGGGFIALEYLPIFRERGIETHLVLRNDHYWRAYLEDESETLLRNIFQAQDIHLHTRIDYVRVEGSAHLEAVDIAGSRISARIMGIGVGLLPNLEPMTAAGIDTGRGILTNEYLETDAPDIYAAGDVAEFMDLTVGRRRILGNWINAQQHGLRAAANMVGDRKPLELVSAYSTSPFGVSITFVGDVARESETTVVSRGRAADGAVGQIFLRDGRVVGTTLINMNRDRPPLTEIIKRKLPITGRERELADPKFDLGRMF